MPGADRTPGISAGSPVSLPSGGVSGAAPGAFGSALFRDWLRNLMRMEIVTPESPLRVISYVDLPPNDPAVALPVAGSLVL